MRRHSETGVWWASPQIAGVIALMPTVVGIFVIIHELTLHDVMAGVTLPAGGVNFAASLALSKGQLPYHDFVLTEPPGMAILLLPFAWVAHGGGTGPLSAARLLTAFVAVIDVFLVGFTARRHGIASTFIAGILLAIFPYSGFATASVMLEPFLVLFCLLAFQAAFTEGELATGGRIVFAGALIGFAITIKPWAIIPAIVLVICAAVHMREALLRVLGGLVMGIGVPCILFFLAAPGPFVKDVIKGELSGGTGIPVSTGLSQRVAELIGFGAPLGMKSAGSVAIGVAVAFGVLIVVAFLFRANSSTMLDWALLGTTLGLVVIGLVSKQVPFAYTYVVAAFGAIVVGNSVGTLLSAGSAFGSGRSSASATLAAGGTIVFMAVMIAAVAFATPKEATFWRTYFLKHASNDSALIDARVPAGSCVVSNDPEVLVLAGRFSDLPAGCPYLVDPAGIEKVAGSPPFGQDNASVESQWQQVFSSARYVVVAPVGARIPFSPDLRRYFVHNFVLVEGGKYRIYENTSAAALR